MKEIRTCIVCKKKFEKHKLNRVYKTADGNIILDTFQKAQTRATYICFNRQCHLNLFKQKALNRVYKQDISSKVYDALAKTLKYE